MYIIQYSSYVSYALLFFLNRTMCKSFVHLSFGYSYYILNFPLLLFAMKSRSKSFIHKGTNDKAKILGLHHIIYTFS